MNRFSIFAAGILAVAITGSQALAIVYNYDETQTAAFGTLDQTQVGPSVANPNPPPATINNFCAPTATMNSFTFLSNAYPGVYGNKLMGGNASWQAAAMQLAGPAYMNTNPATGTTESNWINGKVNYINNNAPGTTIFEGMDSVGQGGQPWVQNANPTAMFLTQMLKMGEDVEIGLSPPAGTPNPIGHVMTLASINWNDADNSGTFNAGDTLSIDGFDPAGNGANATMFNYMLSPGNPMTFSGGPYNGYVLDAALAESPIPEPATIGLLLFSTGMLAMRRKRLAA